MYSRYLDANWIGSLLMGGTILVEVLYHGKAKTSMWFWDPVQTASIEPWLLSCEFIWIQDLLRGFLHAYIPLRWQPLIMQSLVFHEHPKHTYDDCHLVHPKGMITKLFRFYMCLMLVISRFINKTSWEITDQFISDKLACVIDICSYLKENSSYIIYALIRYTGRFFWYKSERDPNWLWFPSSSFLVLSEPNIFNLVSLTILMKGYSLLIAEGM